MASDRGICLQQSPCISLYPYLTGAKDPKDIFRSHMPDLTDAMKDNLERVVSQLCSKGLIPQSIQSDLPTKQGVSAYSKANEVVNALYTTLKISDNSKKALTDICNVLLTIKDDPNLTKVAKDILQEIPGKNNKK